MALIIKKREDDSLKLRLIIDFRRSVGNAKANLEEKIVLPRCLDAIKVTSQPVPLPGEGIRGRSETTLVS